MRVLSDRWVLSQAECLGLSVGYVVIEENKPKKNKEMDGKNFRDFPFWFTFISGCIVGLLVGMLLGVILVEG